MNWGSQEVLYLFWTYMLTEEGAIGLKSNQLYWLCYAGTRKTQNTLLNDRSLAGHFSITEGSWGHSFGRNRIIFLTRQFHYHCCYCSVAKSCLTLQSHGLQQTRLTCPPPSQAVCSKSCPLTQWCYLTISSSATPFSFPPVFSSIGVFSNESALLIKWPKYWSFSISPSNECLVLISFRINWFDLLIIQGTLKSLL